MAHYDCNNCGERGGVAFGHCNACTPKEYMQAEQKIKSLLHEGDIAWRQDPVYLYLEKQMKEARSTFLHNHSGPQRSELATLMQQFKDKHV